MGAGAGAGLKVVGVGVKVNGEADVEVEWPLAHRDHARPTYYVLTMHLLCAYRDDARLLEEVLVHARADDVALGVDEDLDELAEARRVVVARRLGVAEGLEHGVGLQGGGGEVSELLHPACRATPLMPCYTPLCRATPPYLQDGLRQGLDAAATLGAPRQVVHEVLVRLGLARTALAAHLVRVRVRARIRTRARTLGFGLGSGLASSLPARLTTIDCGCLVRLSSW